MQSPGTAIRQVASTEPGVCFEWEFHALIHTRDSIRTQCCLSIVNDPDKIFDFHAESGHES